jgi:hypothetical protein
MDLAIVETLCCILARPHSELTTLLAPGGQTLSFPVQKLDKMSRSTAEGDSGRGCGQSLLPSSISRLPIHIDAFSIDHPGSDGICL